MICQIPWQITFFHILGVMRLSNLEYGCLLRSSSLGG